MNFCLTTSCQPVPDQTPRASGMRYDWIHVPAEFLEDWRIAALLSRDVLFRLPSVANSQNLQRSVEPREGHTP